MTGDIAKLDYQPRAAFEPFHGRRQREAVMICHRRAGKTVAALMELIWRALVFVTPAGKVGGGRFAFMAPTRVRAKEIAWDYLKLFSKPIPGAVSNESELSVTLPNGSRITLYGAENERGMGLYLDGIVFDECDNIPASVDAIVSPALGDRGGWMVYMGVLRGRHNLWKRYQAAQGNGKIFTLFLRASETGILSAEELEFQRRKVGESAYQMQFEGNVSAAVEGAIYGQQMDELRRGGRLRPMRADPGVPLDVFFDVGHSDQGDDWAMWAQQFWARDVVLLDYHARTGQMPSYYAAKIREWETAHGVLVRAIYLPHDGAHRNVVGKTHADYLADAGIERHRIKIVHRTPRVWTSINGMRAMFSRVYINSGKCEETWQLGEVEMPSGVDCLDYYHKKEGIDEGGVPGDVPEHDQYSHGADALRTFAEAYSQGMIEGTSTVARESKREGGTKPRVLTGPGTSFNTMRGKPNVIRMR